MYRAILKNEKNVKNSLIGQRLFIWVNKDIKVVWKNRNMDIFDVGINLYLILMIVGSAGVLCKLAGPVPGIIMTIIMWAVIFSNN